MARIRFKAIILLVSTLALTIPVFAIEEADLDFPEEVPDPAAVNAFRQYWQSFEQYEQKMIEEGKQRYQESWKKVKKEYEAKRKELNKQQYTKLENASKNYKKHLKDFPKAENRPIVLLNLAQIHNMMGDFLKSDHPKDALANKKEALNYIKDIEENFGDFVYNEEALYLKGLVLDTLDKKDDALATWRTLANNAKNSLYGVHANIAVGDHLFDSEKPQEAVRYYSQALKLIDQVKATDPDYEKLRIQYRLAWAAYRAANLPLAVETASALLVPGRSINAIDQREKIQSDAIDLIGDSLYEANETSNTKKLLKRREIADSAPRIGLRVMTRYASNNVHRKVVETGEFLVKEFPTAKPLPEYLILMADAYDHMNQLERRIGSLERLAMLLPSQSLWRTRHKDDFNVISEMEKKAGSAARMAAAHYYERGMASGNANNFLAAGTLYEILLEVNPTNENSDKWRLKHAHCHYFAGRYEEAANLYTELKRNHKLDRETLELASFQLVLTREKQWREELTKAVARGASAKEDPIVIEYLRKLEDSVEEFANKFPANNRSVDLLLVAASANRDQERYAEATKYWERILVSSPNPVQRSLAVRGMIMAATKSGSSNKVISLAKRFLQLEDWKAMGSSLADELKGVISAATFEEGNRLSKDGDVLDGGKVMIGVAKEFPDVPQRDKLFRDGAYMLAIAGDWASAQAAAKEYLSEKDMKKQPENMSDILYLNARGQEFQIRFAEAAQSYIDLALKYPKHPRAPDGLLRAQNLALAENHYAVAAQAAELSADRAVDRPHKITSYENAITFYEKIPDQKKGLNAAKKLRQISSTQAEKARADLLLAKAMYKAGSQAKALADLERLSRRLPTIRKNVSPAAFSAVYGETNFLLGEEAREQFADFNLAERDGNLADNINHKTKYFEKMLSFYDRAANTQHPEWSQRARYETAEGAEAFADELSTIVSKSKNLNDRSASKYRESADRLRKLAKRYYSSNVLARNSNPQLFQNNPWTKKSAVKLTGYGDLNFKSEHEDKAPMPSQDEMPYQWGL